MAPQGRLASGMNPIANPVMVNARLTDARYSTLRTAYRDFSMWTKHHKKRRLGRFVVPAITVAFLSYFSYHSVHGEFGLRAMEQFERTRITRQARLDVLVEERTRLEREVALMSDGSLERDMLDEKARFSLNMSRADEIVIFH